MALNAQIIGIDSPEKVHISVALAFARLFIREAEIELRGGRSDVSHAKNQLKAALTEMGKGDPTIFCRCGHSDFAHLGGRGNGACTVCGCEVFTTE